MAVIGLDLGATKLTGALFDADGNILERAVDCSKAAMGTRLGV